MTRALSDFNFASLKTFLPTLEEGAALLVDDEEDDENKPDDDAPEAIEPEGDANV
jgi:hypothetical protein